MRQFKESFKERRKTLKIEGLNDCVVIHSLTGTQNITGQGKTQQNTTEQNMTVQNSAVL